jgi:N-methylhydantoinase B/oxoprolinase/acetone carboxylase alpha subunit
MLDGLRARDLYEEGLFIPLAKLYAAGEPNETLFAMIQENVRQPEMVLTDLAAQVAANAVGARRVLAFMDEYALDELAALATIIQGRTEAAMRRAITAVPDGVYAHTAASEAPTLDLTLQTAIRVDGDELSVDYAGSAPQQPDGGINCTASYTRAHTAYALKCLLTPSLPSNEGCFRPIHVSAPAGSILNAHRPASVNGRTRTGWRLHGLLFGALASAMPERVQAGNGLMHSVRVYGAEADGSPFGAHFFTGGGRGAGGGRAGLG